MGYTIHDLFDDKVTCESINKYMETNKSALSYDAFLRKVLDLNVYQYGDLSYLEAILMFMLEEICTKKGISGDSSKFHYIFNKIAPEKRLTSLIYEERRIEVRTNFNSFAQHKAWDLRNLFSFLENDSEVGDFDILYFLKRLQNNEIRNTDVDNDYLSSYDIFTDYIKGLDNLDLLEKFFMLGLKYKFEGDEELELPSRLDRIFDMITYHEECSLKRIVYAELGQVSTLEYPNYNEE
jgi:hypothetical protein